MSQKGLANLLKAIIIGTGICGLIVYFYFVPVGGRAIFERFPEMRRAYYPWLVLIWVTAIEPYLVLLCGWRIATEIGRDNSFSEINARKLKQIAMLAASDSIILFVGAGILFALGLSHGIVEVLVLMVVFAGIMVTVVAAALSHLVYRAAKMQEENDLTI